jgi:hypothetical protein
VDIAIKVFPKFVMRTTTIIKVRYSTFRGNIPVTKMPIAVTAFAIRYHLLTVKVVSTRGAQMNLKMFGSNATEMTGATNAKEIPAFVNRNPIVTLTYPYRTPNGRNKNMKILG